MLEALEFIVRTAAALVDPEHWNRKWEKYHTSDDEQQKIDNRDRRERLKKL